MNYSVFKERKGFPLKIGSIGLQAFNEKKISLGTSFFDKMDIAQHFHLVAKEQVWKRTTYNQANGRSTQKRFKKISRRTKAFLFVWNCKFQGALLRLTSKFRFSASEIPRVDRFSSEEVRLTFKMFRNVDSHFLYEISISTLIRLDTIMTDAMYSLSQCISVPKFFFSWKIFDGRCIKCGWNWQGCTWI